MDKKKFKQIKKEAVSKVEDGIVKAKIFIEKHPVACAIGGTAIGAIVAGAIGKKIGFKDGYKTMATEVNDWIYNDQPTDKMYLNCIENGKFMENTKESRNLIRAACAMHLDEGDGVAVLRRDGKLLIDTLITTDDNYMEEVASAFASVDDGRTYIDDGFE